MIHSPRGLAALPNRDDVTPVVRLLTHHIDVLEKELIAARAERDQAFARGLELLLAKEPETPSVDDAFVQGAAPFQSSEIRRLRLLSGIDGDTRVGLATPPGWESKESAEGRPASREQVSSAAAQSDSGIEAEGIKASFIAAARRAAQAASEFAATNDKGGAQRSGATLYGALRRDRGSFAIRAKQIVDEHRRPILFGLATIVLALGALQVGTDHFGRPSKPAMAAAPQSEMKVVAVAPTVPQPPEPAAFPTSPMEAADRRTTAAIPSDEAWQQEFKAPPQPLAGIAARESEAALYRQAAVSDDPAAIYEIASRAADGRGMARDLALAARLFERAATHGLVPAQYRTGKLYEKGLGVPRDPVTAKTWYQRAADNGNALAMHQLAVLTAEGVAGKPDYTAAIVWFRRAAQLGIRDSQFNLAVLLARGLGTAQDLAGSYTWFAVVAAQGDGEAAKKRDEVGARLGATKLAAAKLAAERWRPDIPEKFANEVAPPAQSWSEAPQPKRTASAI